MRVFFCMLVFGREICNFEFLKRNRNIVFIYLLRLVRQVTLQRKICLLSFVDGGTTKFVWVLMWLKELFF